MGRAGGWVAAHIWRGTLMCWILWSIKGILARSCMTSQRRRTLPCVSDCKEPLEWLWSYSSSVHFNSHTPTRVELGNGNWGEFHVLEREREKKDHEEAQTTSLYSHTKEVSVFSFLSVTFVLASHSSFFPQSLSQTERNLEFFTFFYFEPRSICT